VVDVITADPELWADTMMREELGFGTAERDELRAALTTLVAFVTVGFLPLSVFVYDLVAPGEVEDAFTWSAVLTAVAFAAVGGLKSRFVEQSWWRSALETVVVAGLAAVLAYATGAFLQSVV
jgi:VIT1/CCC1 family predicted Fe2+/Mn2+ transporter